MKVEINRHAADFRCDFTIEFEVKNPSLPTDFPEDVWEHEYRTGSFTNFYGDECEAEMNKRQRSKRWYIADWSFAGRSNGWFALLCKGDSAAVTQKQLDELASVAQRFYSRYGVKLNEYYFSAPILPGQE